MRYFIMAKKITRKEVLTSIIAEFKADGVAKMTEDRVEVLEKLLASIEKKSSKVSAKSTENEGIKDLIETSLGVIGEPVTVSALNKSEGLTDFSNQKLSNLLRQMIEEGRVVKSTKGRQSLFSLADDSEVAEED
jgi:hypothetical protein